jgi:WD40 repeat protein
MAFARAGDILLVCDRERLTAVRAGSGEKVWQYAMPNGGYINALATAPGANGHLAAVVGGVGALVDLDTGRARLVLPGKPSLALLVLSADERQLAASNHDGGLWIADAATGAARVRLEGHAGSLVDLNGKLEMTEHSPAEAGAFSADGTLLATAGDDRAVRVWNTATGAQLGAIALSKNARTPALLAFSPDGRWLVVGEESGRLLFADARRPSQVAAMDLAHTAGLEGARPRALAFAPDGATLFVGTGRGPIAIVRR